MRVIPFGVSSGKPTGERNVSGLGVDLGPEWILVDCGEGTQQQVMRSPLKLSKVGAILITHLHGDHVLGLPGLLGTMEAEGRTEPITIVGPVGLNAWIEAMAATPMLGLSFGVDHAELHDVELAGETGTPREVVATPSFTVTTLPLRHRIACFGYRIAEAERAGRVDRGGRIVTVLGDTTPCGASVELARGADLLVHEATYANAEEHLAETWRHSTAAQAAGIAREAGVGALLLTHFSTRYRNPAVLREQACERFAATTLAEENVAVEIPQRAIAPNPAPPTTS